MPYRPTHSWDAMLSYGFGMPCSLMVSGGLCYEIWVQETSLERWILYCYQLIMKKKMNHPGLATNSQCSCSSDEMKVSTLLARLVAGPPSRLYSGLGDQCVNTKQGILAILDYWLLGCHAVSWCLVASTMKLGYQKLALKG